MTRTHHSRPPKKSTVKLRRQRGLVQAMKMIRLGWTQGAFCRDAKGTAVTPGSPLVRRVDIAYALSRCALDNDLPEDDLRELVTAQLARPYSRDSDFGLERWNDAPHRTRTEVIIVLERTLSGL